jgi:hypothetical protein
MSPKIRNLLCSRTYFVNGALRAAKISGLITLQLVDDEFAGLG